MALMTLRSCETGYH